MCEMAFIGSSSKHISRCCDPLQCHKRKRTSGGSYNLRRVSNMLIKKFPSLQLTSQHKICPSCRLRLYKRLSEDVPVSDSMLENSGDATTSTAVTMKRLIRKYCLMWRLFQLK